MTRSQAALVRVVDPFGWAYLDAYAGVSGLSWTWDYSGGPTSASFSLNADANANIPHLTQGAAVSIHRGASSVWAGRVASVDRNGWQVQCDGLGGLVAQETVTTTGPLDSIVDAAIADGLPLTRPGSLSETSWGFAVAGAPLPTDGTTLDQALSQVLASEGKAWTVSTTGVIAAEPLPVTPSLIVQSPTLPPLTLNAYATQVTVIYDGVGNGYANATVTVTNDAAEAKFGRVPKVINLVMVAGGMSAGVATGYANAYLARLSPAMTVAGDIVVTDGQVLTGTGAPIDLPSLRPGQVARLQLVSYAHDTLAVPTTAVDVLIGRVVYDADAGTATLSPMQSAPDPVAVMFGGRGVDITPATS